MLRSVFAASAIGFAGPVASDDIRAGAIVIENPIILKAFAGAKVAGGYMTITNEGHEEDRLVQVSAGSLSVMIHETVEENGVARMRPVGEVSLPAGRSVVFEPGALHIMFVGFEPGELIVGDGREVVLVFEDAGEVPVTFEVAAFPAAGAAN